MLHIKLIQCYINYIFSSVQFSRSVMSDSFQPQGIQLTRLLFSWNSLGKNIGVGSHSLLQGIFSIQGSNPGHLHCRQILYHLNHQGPPAQGCFGGQNEILYIKRPSTQLVHNYCSLQSLLLLLLSLLLLSINYK